MHILSTTWYKQLFTITIGLFLARLLGELIATYRGGLAWPWVVALVVALVLGVVGFQYVVFSGQFSVVSFQWSMGRFWGVVVLWMYIGWPQLDWGWATAVFLLAILIILSSHQWPTIDPRLPATLLAGLGGLLYWHTLAPGLLPADSGEFQTVVATLGVAHPPGFPLYTLLGHLFTWLPGLSPAYSLNLFAALTSSLTLYLVYLTAYRLTTHHGASITAVLALATATTFWSQATTANVRSLTALFAAFILYHLICFRQADKKTADYHLLWAALGLGFGLTHHASLLFMGLLFGFALLLFDPTFIRQPRRWLRPILAGLAGLLPWLYLPWRASAGAEGAAGLATWTGFWDHVLARGFSGDFFYFAQPDLLWPRLGVMGNVLTFQFNGWLLGGMLLGGLWLLWRDRPLALLLVGSFGLHTLITAVYRAPQTVEYMLPAYVPLVLMLAYGCAGFSEQYSVSSVQFSVFSRRMTGGITAVFLTAVMLQGWHHYPSYAALSQQNPARDYAQPILEAAPADALILAHWHWYTPLHYLQTVEGQRPDVEVVFVYPRGEPYEQTWARLAQAGWENGRSVITTHYADFLYDTLPPAQPIGEAYLFAQTPLADLPSDFTPLTIELGEQIALTGINLPPSLAVGETAVFLLAWQPMEDWDEPLTLFAHLVGSDGQIYAQADIPARPQAEGHTITKLPLTPRPGALPGDYTLLIGGYGAEPLLYQGKVRTAVATRPLSASHTPLYTQNQLKRPLADQPEQQLIGYDWDHTEAIPRLYLHWRTPEGTITQVSDGPEPPPLPATSGPWGIRQQWSVPPAPHPTNYIPLGQGLVWLGENRLPQPVTDPVISLPQRLASSQPVTRDLVISTRLIGYEPDGFHWAWSDLQDGVPAMGGIPTLKWIAGSEVVSPYRLNVDETAVVDQAIGGTIRFYDAFTNEPLPILDERITGGLPGIPLTTSAYE